MKKVKIEFQINDEAAKNVAKAAKGFFKSMIGLVKGHGVKASVEDPEKKQKKAK
jgi:hypothetical protein